MANVHIKSHILKFFLMSKRKEVSNLSAGSSEKKHLNSAVRNWNGWTEPGLLGSEDPVSGISESGQDVGVVV